MKIKRIFVKYAVLYLVFFLICVIFMIPTIKSALNSLTESAMKTTYYNLNNQYTGMTSDLSKVRDLSFTISKNDKINRYLAKSSLTSVRDTAAILEISKELQKITLLLPDLICGYQFITKDNLVFTPSRIYTDFTTYYTDEFEYSALSFGEWKESLRSTDYISSAANIRWNMKSQTKNVIPVNTNAILPDKPNYTLVVFLDAERLIGKISPEIDQQVYFYYNNRLILSDTEAPGRDFSNTTESIGSDDRSDLTVYHFEDNDALLEMVITLPRQYFVGAVNNILYRIYFFIGLALLLSCLLAATFAYTHTKSIKIVNQYIQDQNLPISTGSASEYKSFMHTLKSVHTQKLNLETECANMDEKLRISTFEQLLANNYVSPDALEKFQKSCCFPFRLILLDIEALSEQEAKGLFLLLQEQFQNSPVLDLFNDQILLLVPDSVQLHSLVTALKETVLSAHNVEFSLYISNPYAELSSLSFAYDELRISNFYNKNSDRQMLVFCKDILPRTSYSAFTASEATKMTQILLSGDAKLYSDFFMELYTHIFDKKHLSKENIVQTYYQIQKVITGILATLDEGNMDVPYFDITSDWSNQYNILLEKSLLICETVSQKQQRKKRATITKIMEIIYGEFTNPDMCVSMISKQLNISENYICVVIKENTGKTYSEHVENLRIEKSKELLASTNMIVKDVYTAVGYSNENTFYKSFKRICGITPINYRKQNQ